MRSRKCIVLLLAVAVGLLAAGAYAQATTRPAKPLQGEELKAAPKPAEETAGQAPQTQPVPQAGPGGQGGGDKSPFSGYFLPLLLGGMLLLLLLSGRSRRKQEAKRRQMLASLKKGDKVTTAGGVIGTIVEMRDDEIVVKVDETNNVRIRVARWAIGGVGDEAKAKNPQEQR